MVLSGDRVEWSGGVKLSEVVKRDCGVVARTATPVSYLGGDMHADVCIDIHADMGVDIRINMRAGRIILLWTLSSSPLANPT